MKCSQSLQKKRIALNQIASSGDHKYPSFELRVIFNYLSAQGYESWCQRQIDEIGLQPGELEQDFINSYQALNGLKRVTSQFNHLGLGCEIAKTYKLDYLGSIGVCIRSASTLLEAFEISQTYYDLIGSFTDIVNIYDEHSFTSRLVDVTKLDPVILRFLFELTVMGTMVFAKELSGQQLGIEVVRFTESLSSTEIKKYQNIFSCKVEGQAKFNEWVIGLDSLSIPITNSVQSPKETAQKLKILLEELNDQQIHEENNHPALVDDINCILKGSKGDFPDPDMISHALGISSRTLRRRLNKMGTNFSALIDKVRCQLAINLIQHQNLSNEDIAEELGYSDTVNFYHAFKKWTGHTPNYYRIDD